MTIDTAAFPIELSIVPDNFQRYPNEDVTFFVRLDIRQELPDFTIRMVLPKELIAVQGTLTSGDEGLLAQALPTLEMDAADDSGNHYVWQGLGSVSAGTRFEFSVIGKVIPVYEDVKIKSSIRLSSTAMENTLEQTVEISINAKSKYLKYLPSLYEDDDFMGRFLMVFESFWNPIDVQINQLFNYFDPKITPPDFVPWLSSWFNLALDEGWPEEKQRKLIYEALPLYRKRGTRQGLQNFIEIYTGYIPEITEHRGRDFRLGEGSLMGPGLALGQGRNFPYSFTVSVSLPDIIGSSSTEKERKINARQKAIEKIIESEKPAGVVYKLEIDIDNNLEPIEF